MLTTCAWSSTALKRLGFSLTERTSKDVLWSIVLLNHITSIMRGLVLPKYATKVITKLNTACFMCTVLMPTKHALLPVLVSLDTAHFYQNWPLFSCASPAIDTGQYWFFLASRIWPVLVFLSVFLFSVLSMASTGFLIFCRFPEYWVSYRWFFLYVGFACIW